jgi:carbonic anhydrase
MEKKALLVRTTFAALAVSVFALTLMASEPATHSGPTPASAIQKLTRGNGRYAVNHPIHPRQDAKARAAVARGQHPFAAVLSCADSRVPPELLFDEGLGDLFVVRVAGNVVDDAVTGSLEYAAEHLHVPVIVVLGHTKCGAVDATIKGGEPNTHIEALVKAIRPAVEQAHQQKGDLMENAVRENVRLGVRQLQESEPILARMIAAGQVTIIGAVYDLDKGTVEYLK